MKNNIILLIILSLLFFTIIEGTSFLLNKTLFKNNIVKNYDDDYFKSLKRKISLLSDKDLLETSSSQTRNEIINLKFYELSKIKIKKNFEKYSADTFSYTPYREFISNPFSSENLNVNSDGFRGNEFTSEKKNDTFRILMFGSSALFGWPNSSDNETISFYLEDILNQNNNNFNFEVLNLSVKSYNIMQDFINYLIVSQHVDHDMIVIFNGHNDFNEGFFGNGVQYSKINEKDGIYREYYDAMRNKDHNLFFNQGFFYLSYKVKLYVIKTTKKLFSNLTLLIKNLKSKNNFTSKNINKIEFGKNSINTKISYGKILDKWFNLIKSSNKNLIYIHQPNLFATNKKKAFWESLWVNFGRNKNFYLNFPIKTYKENYNLQVEYSNKIASNNKINYIEMDKKISELNEEITIFFDHVHLTNEGNKFVASEISNLVIEQIN